MVSRMQPQPESTITPSSEVQPTNSSKNMTEEERRGTWAAVDREFLELSAQNARSPNPENWVDVKNRYQAEMHEWYVQQEREKQGIEDERTRPSKNPRGGNQDTSAEKRSLVVKLKLPSQLLAGFNDGETDGGMSEEESTTEPTTSGGSAEDDDVRTT